MPRRRAPRSIKTNGFASKFENEVSKKLNRIRVKWQYEPIKLDYILEKSYKPDFVVDPHLPLEDTIIIEAKGVLHREDRVKMLAVKEQHPDLDIRFIFQAPHRKVPHLKCTHAEWAEQHGFKWYALEDIKKRDLT